MCIITPDITVIRYMLRKNIGTYTSTHKHSQSVSFKRAINLE